MNGILRPAGFHVQVETVAGDIYTVPSRLLPTISPPTKSLFIPCKDKWTALLENSPSGTDAGHISVPAEKLRTITMRTVVVPDSVEERQYGAVIWEFNDADGKVRRFLYAMNDGGRWEFGAQGEAFEFEQVERYSERRIAERFTARMLGDYLAEFQAFPFSDDWFLSDGLLLVERIGGYLQEMPGDPEKIH